jgi:hypothetical protein
LEKGTFGQEKEGFFIQEKKTLFQFFKSGAAHTHSASPSPPPFYQLRNSLSILQ